MREPLAKAIKSFALDLYRQASVSPGNLLLSPYSVACALAMVYAGARGVTEREIAAVLHADGGQNRLHAAFAALNRELSERSSGDEVQLQIANSLWPQAGSPLLEEFLRTLQEHYGVQIAPQDFERAPEAARTRINTWVEEQTRAKIRNLIPAGLLGPLTRMVLANAIYFKGLWEQPFRPEDTFEAPFHTSAREAIPVLLMHRTGLMRCAEDDGVQALELPYRGGDFSLLILLPEAVDGLAALERTLDAQFLDRRLKNLTEQRVEAMIPRFRIDAGLRLDGVLSEMGMPSAFRAGEANFAGIDGRSDWLFLSAVLHRAFLEVNEEGAEAAAATAAVVQARSAPAAARLFRADHPFLVLILDRPTGSILFIGRVESPPEVS